MSIYRAQLIWTGWNGAPGYSNLYASLAVDAGDWGTALNALAGEFVKVCPNTVHIKPGSEIVELDETDGTIVDVATVAGATDHVGLGTTGNAGAAGACINWLTDGIVGGRRVRGRTFVVPMGGGYFDMDGTLTSGALGTLLAGAASYVTALGGEAVVWARPNATKGLVGSAHPITVANVRDRVAVLRSRRD